MITHLPMSGLKQHKIKCLAEELNALSVWESKLLSHDLVCKTQTTRSDPLCAKPKPRGQILCMYAYICIISSSSSFYNHLPCRYGPDGLTVSNRSADHVFLQCLYHGMVSMVRYPF